jgi:PKD repeat protein
MNSRLTLAATTTLLLPLMNNGAQQCAAAQEAAPDAPLAIVLERGGEARIGQAIERLRAAGVEVDHAFPPRLLIARMTPAERARLAASDGIARILAGDLGGLEMERLDPRTRLGLSAYRQAFGADAKARAKESAARSLERPLPDALRPPQALHSRDAGHLLNGPPVEHTTSEFMIGTVVVGMILPESNGVAEPSTEDWTTEMVTKVAAEALLGLDYYTQLHDELPLTFIYHFGDAPPPGGVAETVACDYEAIENNMFDWDVTASYFASLGYNESGYFNNSYAWINDLRDLYGADWGYVVQCAADREESSRYADGGIAASYIAGPITAMSYTNGFYGADDFHGVLRHETLHIFGAMDEYVGNDTEPSFVWGYMGVANANSVKTDGKGYRDGRGEGEMCLAHSVLGSEDHLCPYTWGQLGWLDSDDDDLPDPIDTRPITTIETAQSSGSVVTLTGFSEVSALEPTRGHWGDHLVAVSINQIVAVEFSLEGHTWLPADPVDGSFDEWQEEFQVVTPPLPDGEWEIEIRARNNVGNLELLPARRRIAVSGGGVVDAAPFAAARVTPESGGTSCFFTFNAAQCGDLEDPTGKLEVRWDFDGDGTFDTNFAQRKDASWRYDTAGTYAALLEVRDQAGQISSTTLAVRVGSEDAAPVARFRVLPAAIHGEEFASFIFDASASYDAETPAQLLEMRWDWENDGTWDTGFSCAAVRPHTYASLESGTYAHSAGWTVRVEVRDWLGNSATTTRYLWANAYNHEPQAVLEVAPLSGMPGALFHLDGGASSDPDQAQVWDDPVQYRWDFDGDGVFDTPFSTYQNAPQTTFDQTGVYAAMLEVKDRYQGRARASVELAVSEDGLDTPPVAEFSMRALRARLYPESGTEQVSFFFDAGTSWDAESAAAQLRVRWDWESDGVWDTPFTTEKRASHFYWSEQSPVVTLEVRDPEGLWNRITREWITDQVPTPPLGLEAEVGSERVTLSWFPHGEPDVTGYRIYRRLASEPEFGTMLAEIGLETTYTDWTATQQESYVYVVTAVDESDQESSLSDEVAVTLNVPMPPSGLIRCVGDGLVRVHWNPSEDPDLAYYNVFMREEGAEEWIAAGSAWDPEWNFYGLTNDLTYEFMVRAHDMESHDSDPSEPISGTPRSDDSVAPGAPRNLMAALGGDGVLLFWDRVKGDDIYLYLVSRAEEGAGEYELLDITYYYQTDFMDLTTRPGFSYCYAIQALDSFGNVSDYSEELCVDMPE